MLHVREEPNPETAEQMVQLSKGIQIPLIQLSTADTNVAGNIPESLKAGTGHATSHEHTAACENQKQTATSEDVDPAAKPNIVMKNIEWKTLLKRPPQYSHNYHTYHPLLGTKSACQLKR